MKWELDAYSVWIMVRLEPIQAARDAERVPNHALASINSYPVLHTVPHVFIKIKYSYTLLATMMPILHALTG